MKSMKWMKLLAVITVAVLVVLIACKKENSFNDKRYYAMTKDTCIRINGKDSCFKIYLPSDTIPGHGGPYGDTSHYPGSGKDTCIHINGKDSCFKIYGPYNPGSHGGSYGDSTYHPKDSTYHPRDTTYYPGGGKDTCIRRNGKDSCFKLPKPVDSSSKKAKSAGY